MGNAAERVIGLALKGDGTLGAARGERAYFFDDDLRLGGQTATGVGTPGGGIALHPLDENYPPIWLEGGPSYRLSTRRGPPVSM